MEPHQRKSVAPLSISPPGRPPHLCQGINDGPPPDCRFVGSLFPAWMAAHTHSRLFCQRGCLSAAEQQPGRFRPWHGPIKCWERLCLPKPLESLCLLERAGLGWLEKVLTPQRQLPAQQSRERRIVASSSSSSSRVCPCGTGEGGRHSSQGG